MVVNAMQCPANHCFRPIDSLVLAPTSCQCEGGRGDEIGNKQAIPAAMHKLWLGINILQKFDLIFQVLSFLSGPIKPGYICDSEIPCHIGPLARFLNFFAKKSGFIDYKSTFLGEETNKYCRKNL